MPGQIRVSTTWRTATPHIRVGGVWKKAREGWVNISGTWRRWWTSEVPFAYTGSLQTYVVPSGITSIQVDMSGAAGGGGSNTVPGGGSGGNRVQATIPVTPGQTLHIAVGEAGIGSFTCALTGSDQYGSRPGGWPGGGASGNPTWFFLPGCISVGGSGGGYSGIFTSSTLSQANALLIAGGGGGAGVASRPSSANGSNGTTTSGGARGTGGTGSNDQTNGSALQGGNGESNAYASNTYPGAGGGGGYFGGGGGASPSGGAGSGGDGSSWTHASATSVTLTQNYRAGNGYVTIIE